MDLARSIYLPCLLAAAIFAWSACAERAAASEVIGQTDGQAEKTAPGFVHVGELNGQSATAGKVLVEVASADDDSSMMTSYPIRNGMIEWDAEDDPSLKNRTVTVSLEAEYRDTSTNIVRVYLDYAIMSGEEWLATKNWPVDSDAIEAEYDRSGTAGWSDRRFSLQTAGHYFGLPDVGTDRLVIVSRPAAVVLSASGVGDHRGFLVIKQADLNRTGGLSITTSDVAATRTLKLPTEVTSFDVVGELGSAGFEGPNLHEAAVTPGTYSVKASQEIAMGDGLTALLDWSKIPVDMTIDRKLAFGAPTVHVNRLDAGPYRLRASLGITNGDFELDSMATLKNDQYTMSDFHVTTKIIDETGSTKDEEVTGDGYCCVNLDFPTKLAKGHYVAEFAVDYPGQSNPLTKAEPFFNDGYVEGYRDFADVAPDHWAYLDIHELAARRIVQGVSPSEFGPDRKVTRAEFTAMLVKALELKGSKPVAFGDVPADAWYADALAIGLGNDIVKGVGPGTFAPARPVTREEMAIMIMNAARATGLKLKPGPAATFKDETDIDGWASEAVLAASAAGLLSGKENGTFAPKAIATRAEAARMIVNLLRVYVASEEDEPSVADGASGLADV